MPGWVSRFSLGGGQWWFMGKEKLAAGPDVPAFPLFLQPPERCSLFSFPDGQEESDGGNCHCLITVQGPLYDGRHGGEQGSAARAGRGQPGLPFAPGSQGRALTAFPFTLLCVQTPSVLLKRLSRLRSDGVCLYICNIGFFFLLFGEASELVERAMDGQREGMEQSHPRSETRGGFVLTGNEDVKGSQGWDAPAGAGSDVQCHKLSTHISSGSKSHIRVHCPSR